MHMRNFSLLFVQKLKTVTQGGLKNCSSANGSVSEKKGDRSQSFPSETKTKAMQKCVSVDYIYRISQPGDLEEISMF